MARVGGAGKTSGKLIERSTYMSLTVMERKVVEQQAHTQPAASLPRRHATSNCRRQGSLISPFPVSPSGGKPGREGSPHAADTLRASKRRWHTSVPRLPPQEGFQSAPAETPLAHPPDGCQRGTRPDSQRRFAGSRGRKIKDGRHVGLDFYDLLIEARDPTGMRKKETSTS